jgi:hypothetical protein
MLKNTLISCAAAVIILLPVAELPVKEIYQIAGTMVQYLSKVKDKYDTKLARYRTRSSSI